MADRSNDSAPGRSTADPAGRRTVLQGGRRKAYRPLPIEARHAAFEAFLAACARGEWFEAHELLEPAWMGTADLPERNLHQGLIKVAAANVHRGRGNPAGMAKNLAGARGRLVAALEGGVDSLGLDLPGLIAVIDDRLGELRQPGPVHGAMPVEIARAGEPTGEGAPPAGPPGRGPTRSRGRSAGPRTGEGSC